MNGIWMTKTIWTTILCSLLAIIPHDDLWQDSVDLVEVNHGYSDDKGEYLWTQVIWYDWNPKTSDYDIVDYRVVSKVPNCKPIYDWNRRVYSSMFTERFTHELRRVDAKMIRETWVVNSDDPIRNSPRAPCEWRMLRGTPKNIGDCCPGAPVQ